MNKQQTRLRALYKCLLACYPPAFRAQFGESMVQTFNDLINERKGERTPGRLGFVLWLFRQTAGGIVQERGRQIRQGVVMNTIAGKLRSAAFISFIVVLPFAVLKFVLNAANRRHLSDFPIPLFGVLWLLPLIFLVIFQPLVHDIRAGTRSWRTRYGCC